MILDENFQDEEQKVDLSDRDVFIKIWTSPRLVFKFLEQNNYDKYVYSLLILAGIASSFNRASSRNLGDTLPLIGIIASCIIFGGLLGWITYYIYAALLKWTGKWLGGEGESTSILRMLAYAMIPTIFASVFLIIQIILFGNGIFQSEFDIQSNGITYEFIFYGTLILEGILGLWTLVLFVIGLSEIQKFSIGKSILNMILPGLVILGPIVAIILIFRAF